MRAEEDDAPEAARDWLAELQELLLTGGYFRARIAALAPFDKARPRAAPPRNAPRAKGTHQRAGRSNGARPLRTFAALRSPAARWPRRAVQP